MNFTSSTSRSRRAGLSLVEVLLVVAAIALIAIIALPAIGNIRRSAKRATAMQNAKMVAQMSEALAALGVAHVIPDSMGGVEATARLMREGVIVPEGPMAGEKFILSGMRDSEIEDIASYLVIQYDKFQLRLVFQQPPEQNTMLFEPANTMLCRLDAGRKPSWEPWTATVVAWRLP